MAFSNIARTVISIHAPPRGATKEKTYFFTGRGISIHAPPRGATKLRTLFLGFLQHFNSRPSARGDFRSLPRFYALFISIHAPPRGATRDPSYKVLVALEISIHAPPRGATEEAARAAKEANFKSRPSARGDYKAFVDKFKPKLFQFTPLREGRLTYDFDAGTNI